MDIAVFVLDGVADFGFTAVLETFNMANALLDELENPPEPWRVRTVALGSNIRTGHGHLVPTVPLDTIGDAIDVMIMPAVGVLDSKGLINMVSSPVNQPFLERISAMQQNSVHLAAACTGTFFLAEAGVLDGRQATTSWWLGPVFRRRYPNVDVREGLTLCRSTGATTAGAVLSHLDLALSFIAPVSPTLAELVTRYMMVGDRVTQGEYAIPEVMARGDKLVAAFERAVRDRLAEQFAISDIARELGTTTRSLQRATQAELGMSPRDLVDEIRLDRAGRLLRTTTLTIDAIAIKVGYLNRGTLRALFKRRRGRSIAEVRASGTHWEHISPR
ncbi:GlxA family transcriptional regulator [Nocardia sp. CDC160]|uniref:GlxA family transcriptional regulator n=1 Tax=Nocardia sp. CDC160 TaxID=3112166 RepID=UPI002DBF80C0|nr:helix-turn-helix domain-containing protein [Nocardia sp. CDC160]MEC3920321.1 helix-turn-helix domain-containing protein [Nocardia sp. CDC160]